jgi:hypothetical protein
MPPVNPFTFSPGGFHLENAPRFAQGPHSQTQIPELMHRVAREITLMPEMGCPVRRQGVVHAVTGALLLIVAIVGLWNDIEWLAQPFYAWAWWGYILLLDGYCACKRRNSLLSTRRRFVLPICIWSVTFWFFFELINARIQNWYYVGVFPLDAWFSGSVFAVAAFATVFMGIFETIDALNACGLWRKWRGACRRFPHRLTYALQTIGLVLAGLALLFPYYLAPLIWGSFTLIVDPWNYRRGARSLLRDLEDGNYGLLSRLLLAGLICGVLWESLNFFAPQKWIYTVRGLEGLKVFEMPLIGFLGFPALALDCMAAYALISSWLLGNRTWEHEEDLTYAPRLRAERLKSVLRGTTLAQMAFWALVSAYATPINVASIRVDLRDLGLSPDEVRQLKRQGVARPRQFLGATDTRMKCDHLRSLLGWSEDRVNDLRQRAALYTFKGIGSEHGRRLEAAGVRSPGDLAAWEPEALLDRLSSSDAPSLLAAPRLDFVKVWILAARDRNIIQIAR